MQVQPEPSGTNGGSHSTEHVPPGEHEAVEPSNAVQGSPQPSRHPRAGSFG